MSLLSDVVTLDPIPLDKVHLMLWVLGVDPTDVREVHMDWRGVRVVKYLRGADGKLMAAGDGAAVVEIRVPTERPA